MKEKLNDNHIKIIDTITEKEEELMNISGIDYSKFIGSILYPKNSVNTTKYYLVSIQDKLISEEYIPINVLSEKTNIHDAFKLFFEYISNKMCQLRSKINYSYTTEFNVIIYRNPDKISTKIYSMKDILNPKIKYAYFDWGNTICKPNMTDKFKETCDKKYLEDDAEDLLKYLYKNHVNMGIISNRSQTKWDFMNLLVKSGLNKYFNDVIL